jgi:hypothetical protein
VFQQSGDLAVDEPVAHDPAILLTLDDACCPQQAQRLRHGGVPHPGGNGEVGDGDGARLVESEQQGQAPRIREQRETVGPGAYTLGLADGGDGVTDPMAVDGPLPGTIRRDEMHGPIIAVTRTRLHT